MSGRVVVGAVGALAATALATGCASTGESPPVATTQARMVKSYRFEPKAIEIHPGDTVTWTNDDNFTHTVRVAGQGDHRVGRGESLAISFSQPGTYHYVCTLHRHDMDGTVIVR